MIEVQDLTKRYDNNTAIAGVSFRVEAGEVLGFLGPNGAGKTTTMRAITGYIPPTEGRITVDGYDVFEQPLEVRRRIGYLPETPPLYTEMTVRSYLGFVARIKGVAKSDLAAEVQRVMDRVHIREVEERIIGRLSKGYKQRVGLAQALLGDPPVLILDEPTIGLDPKQIHEVRELIKEWKGRHTVILSTHILPEVEHTCSRVIIIDRGHIVAVDTPANLVQQLKGADRTVIEVAGPLEHILRGFRGLDGVVDARAVGESGGRHRIQVETRVGEDRRPAMARMVVEYGWELFEMQAPKMSLEDIFLHLITDDRETASGEKEKKGEKERKEEKPA